MSRRSVNLLLLRSSCAFLGVLMLLFVAVQYNDPDGLWWMLIYSVPAIWSGLAAANPRCLLGAFARAALSVSLILALVAVWYYWPDVDNWWSRDIWWVVETAREGIGMMIVIVVLLVVFLTTRVSDSSRLTA